DLATLKNSDVFAHFQKLLQQHPIDIFCVGPNLAAVAQLFSSLIPARRGAVELSRVQKGKVGEVRHFEETMNVNQAILVMGYRTNCSYLDDDYYALLVGNGVLGGFAHSKLFLNVREKASLAYFVGSSIEGSKGLLTITAGISPDKQEEALKIIGAQVSALQNGEITPEELEQTKRGIASAMTTITDRAAGVIDRNLLGLVEGELRSLDQVVEAIWNVTHADCVRVMEKIQLDSTYILRSGGPREGADDGNN
ncbi:MAG TPA: insulinase family protein, partial [Limnochordia bacterium]|nr:insulinase family protein [Limnochordia bacterium]